MIPTRADNNIGGFFGRVFTPEFVIGRVQHGCFARSTAAGEGDGQRAGTEIKAESGDATAAMSGQGRSSIEGSSDDYTTGTSLPMFACAQNIECYK